MRTKDNYAGIDWFRIPAALLVVAIHTSPLTTWSVDADFFLTRIFARIAVPFFFMVTGQFILADVVRGEKVKIWRYLRRLLILYGIAMALYLPIGIYAGHYKNLNVLSVLRLLVFDGTFYHLWYFPACILGVCLVCMASRHLHIKGMFIVAGLLYFIGLFGDSYYGLTLKLPGVAAAYEQGFSLWSYTRNGLFMVPVFLLLGAVADRGWKPKKKIYIYVFFFSSFLLMTVEAFVLRYYGLQRHDSMYLMLVPTAAALYQILLTAPVLDNHRKSFRVLRSVATGIYIIHPAMIVVVRFAAKISGLTIFIDNSMLHYLVVVFFSMGAALCVTVLPKHSGKRKFPQERTWVEIDYNALRNNVAFLRQKLRSDCKLMPALKANAYGHGAVYLAKELNRLGVDAFCVACVQEGIELRRAGIKGEILILGYTHPSQFDNLGRYHLSQTVIDYSYAEKLRQYGKKLHVHLGIDTGMHRLGERCENIEQICRVFEMPNLIVDGIMTHLSADDGKEEPQKSFTEYQTVRFNRVLEELEKKGIKCPKVHMQASYGVLNYPELAGDYARVGMALYGVLSTGKDTLEWRHKLSPILSLKTRVAVVKEIYPGETAGYGLIFVADHAMKIAVLTIGYADGLPRSLSGGRGAVLIRGKKAPIIGTICMDQTLVDVSDILDVGSGDVAVVIGRSEQMEITVCDLAEQTQTIANEILSRIGGRPERVIVR